MVVMNAEICDEYLSPSGVKNWPVVANFLIICIKLNCAVQSQFLTANIQFSMQILVIIFVFFFSFTEINSIIKSRLLRGSSFLHREYFSIYENLGISSYFSNPLYLLLFLCTLSNKYPHHLPAYSCILCTKHQKNSWRKMSERIRQNYENSHRFCTWSSNTC